MKTVSKMMAEKDQLDDLLDKWKDDIRKDEK